MQIIYFYSLKVLKFNKPSNLIKFILNKLSLNEKIFLVTLNSLMLFHYFIEKKFKKILEEADIIIPESIGIKLIFKIYNKKIKIINGIDFLKYIFSMAEKYSLSIFLLGSYDEILKKAVKNIKKEYPKIKIIGYHNGYFKSEKKILKTINKLEPDILLVGLGSVKQEKWICKNLKKIRAKLFLGVGGSFDVLSGKKKRAPIILRILNLEWLYRLIFSFSIKRLITIFKIFLLLIIVIISRIRKIFKF